MYKYALLLFLPLRLFAQPNPSIPPEVSAVIQGTKNSRQLEKVLEHYSEPKDSLKLKSAYFLIGNMDIHVSHDFYWVDSTGKRVNYSEFNYPDYKSGKIALDSLKEHLKLKAVAYSYRDVDTIKADFIIDNIDAAFEVWKRPASRRLGFADFCEFILPYRVSVEPLQNWRREYLKRFEVLDEENSTNMRLAFKVVQNINSWFKNTYGVETRNEPLPRLGAMQLLMRMKGPCEDISDLTTYILRSQGIPVSSDVVPSWATSIGGHFTNSVMERDQSMNYLDASVSPEKNALSREPSKVIRVTYAKQNNTLATNLKEEDIPSGFLRTVNYKDVTASYWPTAGFTANLDKLKDTSQVIYACVFNNMKWKPTWWGDRKANQVTFENMSKGVVYLPMTYNKGKLWFAGYPYALGYNNKMQLKPDTMNLRQVDITEQENYLIFRPGKSYKLSYWDFGWKTIGSLTANETEKKLSFTKVPLNALLLLIPEYSNGKERPFLITQDKQRIWF